MNCNPRSAKCILNAQLYANALAPTTDKTSKNYLVKNSNIEIIQYKNTRVIDLSNETPTIFVYDGFLNKTNQTEDCILILNDFCSNKKRNILVSIDTKTNKIYVSKKQIDNYVKNNYCIKAKFEYAPRDISTEQIEDIYGFNEISILKMYGYSVGKNGKYTGEREKILAFILDNNILKGWNIVSMINGFIKLRENTNKDFSEAIHDWEHDIMFVEKYVISNRLNGWESMIQPITKNMTVKQIEKLLTNAP